MNSNLTDALANLNYRILNSNQEFPDACWNTASQYNVPYEALADAYDAACADRTGNCIIDGTMSDAWLNGK